MTLTRLSHWRDAARREWPGLCLCAVVALAATFVSEHYSGPQLLYALLIGLALNFLATDVRVRPGLDLCSRTLLRAGVALLGLRITAHQVAALGWQTALLALLALASTLAVGLALARWLRRPADEGIVAGAAVGICGASAALADANADSDTEARPPVPLIPGFLLVFIVFMLANSSGWVPASLAAEGSQWSRHLLVVAIAAVGIKTQPADLLKLGWAPLALLMTETVWIAGLTLAGARWL